MPQRVEGPERSFKCTSDVSPNRRVVVDANGQIAHAGTAAVGIGVTTRAGSAGDVVPVRLFSAPGTQNFEAANATAINPGGALKAGANGQVEGSGGVGSAIPFVSLGPTTAAAGDLIEAAREG